jgi:copper homeostasis protein
VSFILEISVESVAAATAAERAGADRVELCADLSAGGLTPSEQMMLQARENVHIPIFVMIRPRPGNFVYDESEFATMQSQIALARRAKMDGIVLGILTERKTVDIVRTRRLVDLANPLPVTFHRAFDDLADQSKALEDIIATQAARILTSGGAPTAAQGSDRIRGLVETAGSRLIVMPGAGINAENFGDVRRRTGATEFHSGLGTVLPYGSSDSARFENEIRQIVACKARAF